MLVSGMIIGTMFTLFVVPSIYMLVARSHATVPVEAEERKVARARNLAGATTML
jgi:multidrug efflux pump